MLESLGVNEGVDDPIIFKAIFMAGGPGSGKSYIVNKIGFEGMGFRITNSDQVYEFLLKQAGLPMDPETIYSPRGQDIRNRAKVVTHKRETNWFDGRIGVVIDGTGKDYDKISKMNQKLKDFGYETMMVMVNTDLETAQKRNMARARKLPPKEVKDMWQGVQNNIGKFQSLFGGQNMYIIDNSEAQSSQAEAQAGQLFGKISAWSNKVPTNKAAQEWIKSKGGRM